MISPGLVFVRGALLFALLLSAPAVAQEAVPAPQQDPLSLEALTARLDAATAELQAADQEGSYDREARQILVEVTNTLGRAIDERRQLDSPPEAAPFDSGAPSIAALIALHEERARNAQRIQDLSRATEAGSDALEEAEEAFRQAERKRREARDAREESASVEAAAALELARLRSRAAEEVVRLRELELSGDRAALGRAEKRAIDLETRIAAVSAELRASGSAAREPDEALAAREGEISRKLEAAQRDLATAELQLAAVTTRFQSEADPSETLIEQVATSRLIRDVASQTVAMLEARRARATDERLMRERWAELLGGEVTHDELEVWIAEVDARLQERQRTAIQRQGRISEVQGRLSELVSRLDDRASPPALRRNLELRQEALRSLVDSLQRDVDDLTRQISLERTFLTAVRESSGEIPLLDRVFAVGKAARDLWRYEITTVDDEAITVGNAILAILLISLGFGISRRASLAVRHLIENRFRLEPGVAGAVQTAVFYVLLLSFGLIALRSVNFPLTAFTVAGGALAIGIGFGSQNVMNNFISGLILMLERPVRSQDVVEVESTHGTIEHIGARSTRIRATDGRHIIVPNSFFLENNVVNWTLSDDLIRTKVTVGVIYGSPTARVKELIEQALDENNKVLPHPKPIIIFADFGDNALIFDSYFWVRARSPMLVYQVESEVRFRIDELFRADDLVIAFPQRDVHLDSVAPIEVKLVDSARNAPGSDGGDDPA